MMRFWRIAWHAVLGKYARILRKTLREKSIKCHWKWSNSHHLSHRAPGYWSNNSGSSSNVFFADRTAEYECRIDKGATSIMCHKTTLLVVCTPYSKINAFYPSLCPCWARNCIAPNTSVHPVMHCPAYPVDPCRPLSTLSLQTIDRGWQGLTLTRPIWQSRLKTLSALSELSSQSWQGWQGLDKLLMFWVYSFCRHCVHYSKLES